MIYLNIIVGFLKKCNPQMLESGEKYNYLIDEKGIS